MKITNALASLAVASTVILAGCDRFKGNCSCSNSVTVADRRGVPYLVDFNGVAERNGQWQACKEMFRSNGYECVSFSNNDSEPEVIRITFRCNRIIR